MANANVIHGKNGAIYIDGVKVANKTEWMLSLAREYADVTTFRDKNKVSAAGLIDLNGTFTGLFDTSGEVLITKNTGTSHTVALHAVDGTEVASGPAFVDCAVTANSTDAVRVQGNFRAAGDWTVAGLTL